MLGEFDSGDRDGDPQRGPAGWRQQCAQMRKAVSLIASAPLGILLLVALLLLLIAGTLSFTHEPTILFKASCEIARILYRSPPADGSDAIPHSESQIEELETAAAVSLPSDLARISSLESTLRASQADLASLRKAHEEQLAAMQTQIATATEQASLAQKALARSNAEVIQRTEALTKQHAEQIQPAPATPSQCSIQLPCEPQAWSMGFSLPFDSREVTLAEEEMYWPHAVVPVRYQQLAQQYRIPQLFGVPAPYCEEWTALGKSVGVGVNRSDGESHPPRAASLAFPCVHPNGEQIAHIVATVVTFCRRQNATVPLIQQGWGSWFKHMYYASATPQLGVINLVVPHSDRWARSSMEEMHALKALVDLHPGAPWYMKSDDDAWVHVPRAVRMLAAYDPDQPWYIGNELHFANHAIPGSDKTIPHLSYCAGGTGYYLSRAAMSLIYPHLLDPILSCCSDVQLGYLTQQFGFGCTEIRGIIGGPIGNQINETVISFHYITPPQQQWMNQVRYPVNELRTKEFNRTNMRTSTHVTSGN